MAENNESFDIHKLINAGNLLDSYFINDKIWKIILEYSEILLIGKNARLIDLGMIEWPWNCMLCEKHP